MSQIPPFSQFATRRPVANAMQQALILERFTDDFVETRQGSCWIDGDNAWLLEADERREFTARAQEIIAQRFVYERRATFAVIVTAPMVFMLLLWALQSLAKLPEPWPMGLAVGFTVLLAMSINGAMWWQDWKLAQLRERIRLRMRGRDALPAQLVRDRQFGNPWLVVTQWLAGVTVVCTMAFTLIDPRGLGLDLSLPAGWVMPPISDSDLARWSFGAVALVWLSFGLSRIRRWRNGRKESRLAEDRRLAALPLPGDRDVERDPLNRDRDLAAFDRLLAGTAPPPTA